MIPNLLEFVSKQPKSYQNLLESKVIIYSLLEQGIRLIGEMNYIYIRVLWRSDLLTIFQGILLKTFYSTSLFIIYTLSKELYILYLQLRWMFRSQNSTLLSSLSNNSYPLKTNPSRLYDFFRLVLELIFGV